jgi:hypothetical protein
VDCYYKVFQEESESEQDENDDRLYEEEGKSDSSLNPTISEVDHTKYSEDGGFFKDHDAFFEHLEEMTARIDAESGKDDDTMVMHTMGRQQMGAWDSEDQVTQSEHHEG